MGQIESLKQKLMAIECCEYLESDSDKVLIVVTDTENNYKDQIIFEQLRQLDEIQNLSMVFGHSDESEQNQKGDLSHE
jgi:nitrate reductase NapAB chaperone NapD